MLIGKTSVIALAFPVPGTLEAPITLSTVPAAGLGPMAWSARVMVANRQLALTVPEPDVPLPVPLPSLPATGSTRYTGLAPVTASQVVQVWLLQTAVEPRLVLQIVSSQQPPEKHVEEQQTSLAF